MQKILILFLFFYSSTHYSQIIQNQLTIDYNNIEIPKTPSASSFEQYGNTPVDLSTGIPNINIPIYTLSVDGMNVPISISYHASGVKVDEFATQVGLNWTLNAGGGIYRTIRSKPDEEGWLTSELSSIPEEHYINGSINSHMWQYKTANMVKTHDHNPDDFSYSFLNYSGSFILDKSKNLIYSKKDNIDITFRRDTCKAKDYFGNHYQFDEVEKSKTIYSYGSIVYQGGSTNHDGYSSEEFNSAWKLSNVTTKNGKSIDFNYQPYEQQYRFSGASDNLAYIEDCSTSGDDDLLHNITTNDYEFKNKLITQIASEDTQISFYYSDEPNPFNNPALWRRKLDSIQIKDLIKDKIHKSIHFKYDEYSGENRLKLTEVFEIVKNKRKPSYKFYYNQGNIPSKSTRTKDFFGYYNGSSTGRHSLVPTNRLAVSGHFPNGFINANAGNRELSESHIQNGILEKIKYPTGGSTEYYYEPNKEGDNYCGGLRIKKVLDKDELGSIYNEKHYKYTGLQGLNLNNAIDLIIRDEGGGQGVGGSTYFHSNFVADPRVATKGYYYEKVTVESISNTQITSKEVHSFGPDYTQYQIGSKIEKQEYFIENNTTPLKTIEYEYSLFGEGDMIEWRVVSRKICAIVDTYSELVYRNDGNQTSFFGNKKRLPTKIITTDYSEQQQGAIITTQEIDYESEFLLKIKDETNTSNNEGVIKKQYTYGMDHATGYEILNTYPFSTEIFNNNLKVSGQYFEYDSSGNIKGVYKYNKGEGSHSGGPTYVPNDYERTAQFLNNQGKPTQIKKEDGTYTAYIWDNTNTYLLAEVVNATYANASSYLTTSLNLNNPSNIESQVQLIRDGLPSSQVTTYIYEPLKGVSKIIDPKGLEATYHYDDFGRLEYVKDKNSNILSKNEYHYKDN